MKTITCASTLLSLALPAGAQWTASESPLAVASTLEVRAVEADCHQHDQPTDADRFILVRSIQTGTVPGDGMMRISCSVLHGPGDLCSWEYPFRPIASFHATIDDVLCAIKGLPQQSVVGVWRLDGARVELKHEARTIESQRVDTVTVHEWTAP